MTSKELEKYIGKYVSFDVDDLAYLPLPKIVERKHSLNNNHHFEGILCTNTGTRSHFSLNTEMGGVAILDKDIPFIEHFKVKEELFEMWKENK